MSEQMSSWELTRLRRRMLRNLLREGDEHDFSIMVPIPDKSQVLITAHSHIMVNFSPLIRSHRQMLRCNCSNLNCGSNINELGMVIADTEVDTVHLMLKLAYCGHVTIDAEQKVPLIKLLNQLGVKGIVDDDDKDVCNISRENHQNNENNPQSTSAQNGLDNNCSARNLNGHQMDNDKSYDKDQTLDSEVNEERSNKNGNFVSNKSNAFPGSMGKKDLNCKSKSMNIDEIDEQSSPGRSCGTRTSAGTSTCNNIELNNSPNTKKVDDSDDDDEVYDIDDDEYSSDSETSGSYESDASEEVREKYRTRGRAEDREENGIEDEERDEEQEGEKRSRKRSRITDEEEGKCGKSNGPGDKTESGEEDEEEEEEDEAYEEESDMSNSESEEENDNKVSESKPNNKLSLKTPHEMKQCVRCQEEFSSNRTLAFHLTTHLRDEMSQKLLAETGQKMEEMRSCPTCKREFSESNGVPNRLRHLLLKHHFGHEFLEQSEQELLKTLNIGKGNCKKREKRVKKEGKGRKPEKKWNFQCERCEKLLGTYSGICYHVIIHHKDIIQKRVEREAGTKIELMDKCFKCDLKFAKPPFLAKRLLHFAKKHSVGLDRMNCEERKFFENAKNTREKSDFRKPTLKFSKKILQKDFKCNRCGKIFKDRKGFCFHLIAHAGPKLLKQLEKETRGKNENKCPFCNHLFTSSDTAKLRHVVLEHGLGLDEMTASERSVFRMQARLKERRIQMSKKKVKSAKNEKLTLKVKKGEPKNVIRDDCETKNEESRAMQCGRCDRSFDLRGSLVMHIITHIKNELIKLIENEKGISPYEMKECFVCQAPMKSVGTGVAVQSFLRHLVCHHDFGLSLLTRDERKLLNSIEKTSTKMVSRDLNDLGKNLTSSEVANVNEEEDVKRSILDELDEEFDKMREEALNNQLSVSIVRVSESKLTAMNAIAKETHKSSCIDHFEFCFDEEDDETTRPLSSSQ